jgi:hypothetical protein
VQALQQSRYYMPRSDPGKREWFNNFVAIVQQHPSRFGLEQHEVDHLAWLAQEFEARCIRAWRPVTKSPEATQAKNEIRKLAKRAFESAAMRIKRMGWVSNEDKISLGIHVDKGRKSPIPAPRSAPELVIDDAQSGRHRLRYLDPARPKSNARPYGVAYCEVRVMLDCPPGREHAWAQRGRGETHFATRHVFEVPHDVKDAGRCATYMARWVTERGLAGPWSMPVSMTIVAAWQPEVDSDRAFRRAA